MDKEKKLSIIVFIILFGFFVGAATFYILGNYLNLPYPFNTFLFNPTTKFSDFFVSLPKSPFAEVNGVYFPISYILLIPFVLIKNKIISYLIFYSIFLGFVLFLNIKFCTCKSLNKLQNIQNIFILTFLSYPMLYSFDRGNIDTLLFIPFALSIFFFKNENYFFSAVLLALENAMKPFMLPFVLLFLFKKKYKEFFLNLILTVFFIILGFELTNGNFYDNICHFIINCKSFMISDVYNPTFASGRASSLLSLIKLIFCLNWHILSPQSLLKYYNYIAGFLTLIFVTFAWKEKVFWKQIMILTLFVALSSHVFFDYKLIFFFIPLLLFITTTEKSKFDCAYATLFGLLMIPKGFFIYFTHLQIVCLGVAVNPILMIIFTILLVSDSQKK